MLVAVLVLAELLLPVHLVGHLDDAPGSHCDVCLIGHGMGAGTLDSSTATPLGLASFLPVADSTASAHTHIGLTPRQRGPPGTLHNA